MYAVLETGSKQYRVAPGDTVEIERLETGAGQEAQDQGEMGKGGEGCIGSTAESPPDPPWSSLATPDPEPA